MLAAVVQESLSEKGGRGLEHQLPHLYSQVGVGEMVVVEVQREGVGLVEVVGVGVGLVDDDEDTAPQGSVDSRSTATYKSNVELPPHISDELPVHGILH